MKDLQKTAVLFILFIMALSFTNCQNEETDDFKYEYKSVKVDLNKIISEKIKAKTNFKSKSEEEYIISSSFKTDLFIPENLNKNELTSYLTENINSLTGLLEIKINGEIETVFKYNNGEIVETLNLNIYESKTMLAKDCSFEGVRVCTKDRIYSMSKLSKIICAFTFWECYAEEAANCTVDNCF